MSKGTLSGGSNPPLSRDEKGWTRDFNLVFREQYNEAMRRDVVKTMNVSWLDDPEWQQEIARLTEGHYRVSAIASAAKAKTEIGVEITDLIDRPRVVQALRVQSYKFADGLALSTQTKLADTLATGTDQGETIAQLTKRVQAVFGYTDPETGEPVDAERAVSWRAERIARTESSRADNYADAVTWQETGVVEGREWLASGDACPFCLAMDGQKVEITDMVFKAPTGQRLTVGSWMSVSWQGKIITMHFDYMDVTGNPLHSSCRCTTVPILIEGYRKEGKKE